MSGDFYIKKRPYKNVVVRITHLADETFAEFTDGNLGNNDSHFVTVEDRDGFRIIAKCSDEHAAREIAMSIRDISV